MNNLRNNQERLDKLNNQLSTGKKISVPSDDPVGTLRSIQYQTILKQNEQYIENINQAKDWINTSEMALNKMTDVLQQAREIGINGANGTLEQKQRDSLKAEVDELAEHLVGIANTTIGNRFVFSGYKTTTKPYDTPTPTYNGDNNYLSVEISKDTSVKYNIPGDAVFNQAFTALNNLKNDLATGDADNLSNTTLDELDNVLDQTLTVRANFGAKAKRLELAVNRFDEMNVNHKQLLSEVEDVDIAKTIMELKTQENVYRTSLASSARIIQPTLIDFLR